MRLFLLLAVLLGPAPALGGAWMRDEGTTFLSFGATVDEAGRIDGAIYVEHGLRPKLTLGIKVDMDMTQGQMDDGTAFVFARRPIPTGERTFNLAYEIGLGSSFGEDNAALAKAALSYGRGINLWEKSGWLALDGAFEWDVDNSSATYKLDGTLGLSLSARFQVMMQIFVSQTEAETSTTLAPSVIWRPKADAPTRYHLGLESEQGTLALKLGLWRDF